MTVQDLIRMLKMCNPHALVIENNPVCGCQESTGVICHREIGGVGTRFSFETVPAVELTSGNIDHLRTQGLDVLD